MPPAESSSLPAPATCARRGAALTAALGAPGALALAGAAVVHHQPSLLRDAASLLAATAVAGAAGGLAWSMFVRPGAERLTVARPWFAGALVTISVVVVAHRVLVGPVGRFEAIVLFAAALAFAALMADALVARTSLGERIEAFFAHDAGRFSWIVVLAFLAAGVALRDRDGDPVYAPDDAEEAREMLPRLRREAERKPGDAWRQYAYGIALGELERYDQAIGHLRRAVQLDSAEEDYRNAYGWALMRRRRYEEALPQLRAAVRLDPAYGHAWHNVGYVLLQLQREEEAIAAYRIASRLKPKDPGVRYEYAWALWSADRSREAMVEAERAATLDTTSAQLAWAAGFILSSQARFTEAVPHLERLVRLDPKFAAGWAHLGYVRYLMHDAKGAAAAFARANDRDPAWFERNPVHRLMWEHARNGDTGDVGDAAVRARSRREVPVLRPTSP